MADSISDLQKDTFYWQRLLRLAGYYHGAIDGIPGNGTRNGTERWSTDADRYKMEIGCFDERTERNISTLLPEAQKAARQWFKLARNEAANQGYEGIGISVVLMIKKQVIHNFIEEIKQK